MKTPLVNNSWLVSSPFKSTYQQQQHEIQNGLMRNRRRSTLHSKKNGRYYASMVDLASDTSSNNMHSNGNGVALQQNRKSTYSNTKDKDVINNKRNNKTSRADSSLFGTSAVPAWKLKKALKAFKMVKLNEVELEFGSPHVQVKICVVFFFCFM